MSLVDLQSILESHPLPEDAIEVARIGEAWGVKGWFKVVAHSKMPEAVFSSKRWYLQPAQRGAITFSGTLRLPISQVKTHGDTLVAQSLPIADRTAAELLRGARVFIPRASFPTPDEGEYYWVDLIGCRVSNRQGADLGVVQDLLPTGPQTTLVLAFEANGKPAERLIPFVNAFVDSVDTAAKTIVVDWQADYD